MNEQIEKLESGDFVVTASNETNIAPEYVVTGDDAALPTVEDRIELDASRRRQLAAKLALLKLLVEERQRQAVAEPRLAKKKAKNRAKNRVAKASRKRNRGR